MHISTGVREEKNRIETIKQFFSEDKQVKIIFAGVSLVLLVTIIPLYIISHYNFMSMDDVNFAVEAEQVWDETHSVLRVFFSQFLYSWRFWEEWQGTFAATWLCTSLMGIFQRDAYYAGTYITLTGFILSELFLFLVILIKLFHSDFFRAAIVSIGVICLQILLTTYPVEAFYWFCGAILYTCPYSEAMLLCAMLVLLYCRPDKKWQRNLIYAGIILMTYMASGSTYITLIGMLCIYASTTAYFWRRNNPGKYFITCSFFLFLIGFLVNVLAPGNQIRLSCATDTEGMSAAMAILQSLIEAAKYIMLYTMLPGIILGILFLPLFANIVRKKNFSYPLPVLVTVFTFCIFAAQFTPTLYTIGITGAGRVQNIYRWTYYIWFYANEMYWVGWALRRIEVKQTANKKGCFLLPGWVIGGIALIASLYFWGGDLVTTVSAVKDLRNGEAAGYYQEYLERMEILEDDTITDVVLEPYSHKPYLLFFEDITDDPDYWSNRLYATYYGKNSVKLSE